MRHRHEPRGIDARFSHPLLVLLIAAIAAVGAIAQCGLLLDAAAAEQGTAGTPALTEPDTASRAAPPPRVAAAADAAPSPAAGRTN